MKTLLLLFVSCLVIFHSTGQPINEPYIFPVKPGSESWKKFKSGAEMSEACQIPPDILHKLTSDALLKTCFNYPLFIEIYAHSNIQEGFKFLKDIFNGFQELLDRKDAGQYLIAHYRGLNPEGYGKEWRSAQKGEFVFEITKTELLLSQYEIIKGLSEQESKLLLTESHKKYEAKKLHEIYGFHSLKNSALIMGRVIDNLDLLQEMDNQKTYDSVRAFLDSGATTNNQIIEEINQMAKSALK